MEVTVVDVLMYSRVRVLVFSRDKKRIARVGQFIRFGIISLNEPHNKSPTLSLLLALLICV